VIRHIDSLGSESVILSVLGISRSTFYRLKSHGLAGLEPQSKRPKHVRKPQWDKIQEAQILRLRKQEPTWGKNKIHRLMIRDHNMIISVTTVGKIISKLIANNKVKSAYFAANKDKPKRRKVFNKHATYSDPVATGEENKFNWEAFHPEARSQRLFIHGRASMYRASPFDLFDFNQFLNSNVLTEDILLSYAYALHYGMNAIKVTPGAIVYYKPQTEKLDKEKKVQRTQKEIQKIESFFPYFKSFSSILKRKNKEAITT